MTKGLPDPPFPATTAHSSFGNCECSHPSLFAVREGVDFEDALVHLSTLLKGAFATNLKAMELATGTCHDLLLGNDHGLDAAKAVVEALLVGVEMQQVEKARLRTV
ncbi:hypothetical protein QVM52_01970 [Pseudomonas mosselii]|nr:hypothetical protein [Pseudomonas mosselii]MCL8298336.1 hypothetical protein [Pseudomonas mosselii]MCL8338480.1 hypothetical protein [Pseudomonas mosselii]WJR31076.1 hypothetical protein LU678_013885 [Pseudomonas mosselii]